MIRSLRIRLISEQLFSIIIRGLLLKKGGRIRGIYLRREFEKIGR
jgi:hypothetical protein